MASALVRSWAEIARTPRVAAYFLFLQGLPGVPALPPYSIVWWSLVTEVQFYLVLPLLPLALESRSGRVTTAALVLSYAGVYAGISAGGLSWGRPPFFDSQSLVGRAPLFAMGIATAWLFLRYGERWTRWAERALPSGVCDLALVAVLFTLGKVLGEVHRLGYPVAEATWPMWHVLEGALWSLVLWLAVAAPLWTKNVLTHRVVQTVGVLSYSIYVLHYPLLLLVVFSVCGADTCSGWTSRTVLAMVFFAVVLLFLSALTYTFIERPFLHRKKVEA